MNRPVKNLAGDKMRLKYFLCIIAALAVFPFLANAAAIYRWTDDDGVIHVTDDSSKIPAKYWEQERVRKEEIKPSPDGTKTEQPPKPAETPKSGDIREMYGDYPLEWWMYKFKELRKNISDTEERLEREKNFVTVFEGGRRYGKIYSKDEISQYESYKTDIPVTEEKLNKLKGDIEELQRKARVNGVPKKVME